MANNKKSKSKKYTKRTNKHGQKRIQTKKKGYKKRKSHIHLNPLFRLDLGDKASRYLYLELLSPPPSSWVSVR